MSAGVLSFAKRRSCEFAVGDGRIENQANVEDHAGGAAPRLEITVVRQMQTFGVGLDVEKWY